jgi:Tfp pilus assembly protein PilO
MIDSMKGKVTARDWTYVAVILACTFLLFAVFYFVIYTNQVVAIASVNNQIRTVETDLATARQLSANIDELRDEVDKIQTLVSEFSERLPETREIPGLLQTFEDLAQGAGLQVELSPKDRLKDERKETYPYAVTVRGNFHQIVTFVNELERFKRYLKISDLDLQEQEFGVSEANFTLSTYKFIESSGGVKS